MIKWQPLQEKCPHISMMNAASPESPLIRIGAFKPDETLAKCILLFFALRWAVASICSPTDSNTSIMYEGPAMSQYSLWAHIAAMLAHIKTSFRAPVSAEILQLTTDRHKSVFLFIF